MPVYLVTQVEVHDPEGYRPYTRAGHDAVVRHGGRFLAEGVTPEPVEGNWNPRRMAIVEFRTREDALAFYNSPEYQAAKEIRRTLANFNMVLLEPAPT